MAETATVTVNTPGWIDLGSPDPAASHAFYSQLFGWTTQVTDDPAFGGYAMFKIDGKEVGGVGPLQNEQQPNVWTIYVIVENAAATAARVKEAGGTVHAEPFDVMGQGTMGIIALPSGAMLGIWQPGEHRGFEVRGVPGSYAWAELWSRALPADETFLRTVFGWDPAGSNVPNMEYTEFKLEGASVAGGMEMPEATPAAVPSNWLVYFNVTDADAVVATTQSLGGTVTVPATDIEGVGRFAILSDPHGAAFAILQPGS